jgi:hypothetical protein
VSDESESQELKRKPPISTWRLLVIIAALGLLVVIVGIIADPHAVIRIVPSTQPTTR